MTNFNQKVKILKALNFGHDTESNFVKTILQYIKKPKFTSAKKLLKSIIPKGII